MLGQPVVAGDRVFVGSTDNYLYALDAETRRVWPGDPRPEEMWWERPPTSDSSTLRRSTTCCARSAAEAATRSGSRVSRPERSPRHRRSAASCSSAVTIRRCPRSTRPVGRPLPASRWLLTFRACRWSIRRQSHFEVAMVALTRDGRAIGLRSDRHDVSRAARAFRFRPCRAGCSIASRLRCPTPNLQLPTPNRQVRSPQRPSDLWSFGSWRLTLGIGESAESVR